MKKRLPFNRPYMTGHELDYIKQAHESGHLSGDGQFTAKCHDWLQNELACYKALLTHSCTAALEMSAILLDLQPGDEVIMPSYTFVSTANAFVLRGAKPVFVDIRRDTLNIDENKIEAAITKKTKAIVPVHYAGVGCEMNSILAIAKAHDLRIVEDAAQGLNAWYRGQPLGSIGDMGTISFHETKNVISGEGGALIINNEKYTDRAEIIRDKGTNRKQFLQGHVDKYTWVDVGSSFLPSEIIAAFLYSQLENSNSINAMRLSAWSRYHEALEQLEEKGKLRRPTIPEHCQHNGHLYYILLDSKEHRDALIQRMSEANISAVFHYIPLHQAPVAAKFCDVDQPLGNTEELSGRLLRLPLWPNIQQDEQARVLDVINCFLR